MAAPRQSADFAHVLGADLGLPVTAVNIADIESDPDKGITEIPAAIETIGPRSTVVVELGDNVSPAKIAAFEPAYKKLLGSIKAARLACTSTWWRNPEVDAVLQRDCAANGGKYVYIGDLFAASANTDRKHRAYLSRAVNGHPRRWGHAQIAERITTAIQ